MICGVLGVLVATPAVVVLANLVVFRQAKPFIYQSVDAVPARAITIVPGNMVINGVPVDMLAQRLNAALMLYRMGKTQVILVSGNRQAEDGYDEVAAMHRWLVQRGVSDAAIVDDPAGFRTLDTMERAARIFKVKSAIVCSQGVHLPRSVYLARHAGIDAVGLVTNPGQPAHMLYMPHETLGSAVAFVETSLGRGPEVLGPAQPIESDTRTTASLP
ncbi:MAG: SanA protein [Myxococcales bacterium]|nr:SanA protein [Myxococcales bacterium]